MAAAMEDDWAEPRDLQVGAGQGSGMSSTVANEPESEESLLSIELRETLDTLGLGDLSVAVRHRVLLHVGNDVARAVDWIMENGDQVFLSFEISCVDEAALFSCGDGCMRVCFTSFWRRTAGLFSWCLHCA